MLSNCAAPVQGSACQALTDGAGVPKKHEDLGCIRSTHIPKWDVDDATHSRSSSLTDGSEVCRHSTSVPGPPSTSDLMCMSRSAVGAYTILTSVKPLNISCITWSLAIVFALLFFSVFI